MHLTPVPGRAPRTHGPVLDEHDLNGFINNLRAVRLPLISLTQDDTHPPAVPPIDPR